MKAVKAEGRVNSNSIITAVMLYEYHEVFVSKRTIGGYRAYEVDQCTGTSTYKKQHDYSSKAVRVSRGIL